MGEIVWRHNFPLFGNIRINFFLIDRKIALLRKTSADKHQFDYNCVMDEIHFDEKLLVKYEETCIEIILGDQILNYREYLEVSGETFYMITAANPFSNELTSDENDVLNEKLKEELLHRNLEFLPGIGRDSKSAWSEKGWVVRGLTESELIAMAQKYDQNAIFRFDNAGQHVIKCR